MDVQLQELIDKIKKDGVASAESSAAAIIAEAEKKAAAIIAEAENKAAEIVKAGKSETARMEKAREEEPDLIKQYVAVNQITQQPTRSGLYIIEKKKGNGPMVEQGKAVKVNYTGKLLDGKVFDTSVKSVAQEAGIYNPARNYEPLSYVVGEMSLIQGWEQAMSTLRQGSVATIIMPSALGYGARGSQEIPPYSPLVFELEVVSVK